MIVLTLPMPPSTNRLWRIAGKRLIRSEAYKSWQIEAGWIIQGKKAAGRLRGLTGPYLLDIEAARGRRRDLDNIVKAASDIRVKQGVVRDDSDCAGLTMRWTDDLARGTIRVRVEEA